MRIDEARRIIDTLANGIHPVTGEVMPEDSPYNDPIVVRALFAVSRFLQDEGRTSPRRAPPANSGKPWLPQEDERLRAAHAAGRTKEEIGRELQRSAFAVEVRLTKLGLVPPQPGVSYTHEAQEPRRNYFN